MTLQRQRTRNLKRDDEIAGRRDAHLAHSSTARKKRRQHRKDTTDTHQLTHNELLAGSAQKRDIKHEVKGHPLLAQPTHELKQWSVTSVAATSVLMRRTCLPSITLGSVSVQSTLTTNEEMVIMRLQRRGCGREPTCARNRETVGENTQPRTLHNHTSADRHRLLKEHLTASESTLTPLYQSGTNET